MSDFEDSKILTMTSISNRISSPNPMRITSTVDVLLSVIGASPSLSAVGKAVTSRR